MKMIIGKRMKAARLKSGYTQIAVAKALSISQARLSKIENGTADLLATELRLASHLFDLPLRWFFRVM